MTRDPWWASSVGMLALMTAVVLALVSVGTVGAHLLGAVAP